MLKTQQDLYKALITLIKKKPYNQITVDELCKEADIQRPTFYNHYKDKDTFTEIALTDYFSRVLISNYSLDNLNFKDYFFTLIETCLYQINDFKKSIVFLKENASEHIVYMLFNKTIYSLLEKKYSLNNEYNLDEISQKLLLRSYTGIFINIINYFVNEDSISVDEVLDKLADLAYKIYFNKK